MTTDELTDDYYQERLTLGNLGFNQEVRLMVHSSTENYSEHYQELFGRLPRRGRRDYYHARPFLMNRTSPPLGNIQAWYYPDIRTAMMWEVDIFDHYRQENPLEDPLLAALWGAFEGLVLDRSRGVQLVYTPNWEPVYEQKHQEFQQFLERQGYRQSPEHLRLMAKTL